MEHVVYILGAGFSAPLGIPVVRNFLETAHDLMERDPNRFAQFQQIFDRISQLAVAKTYYDADVENVEEVLSMLEMAEYASPSPAKIEFARFICDVIEASTPPIKRSTKAATGDLVEWVFGDEFVGRNYGCFVAGLCGLRIEGAPGYQPVIRGADDRATKYTVVSLNYDRALEACLEFLRDSWGMNASDGFEVYPRTNQATLGRCVLAKLHGSVDQGPGGIVPPTWNKVGRPTILAAWQRAYAALSNANRIRIIGYSLPDNDAHFRYLLKMAATHSANLKSIDVLCRDDDNETVAQRYRAFVTRNKLQFRSEDSAKYLIRVGDSLDAAAGNAGMPTKSFVVNLEKAHTSFFARA